VTRRRLTPDQRRALILDETAAIVSNEGVSAVSFERVALDAGISKALVYAYYGNRLALLAALLLREYPVFRDVDNLTVEPPLGLIPGFEATVRATTIDYLDHVEEQGILLQRLLAEPAVGAAMAAAHRRGRAMTAAYFGGRMAREFAMDDALATRIADILMGVTGTAGALLYEGRCDRDVLTDLVVRIIMAAVRQAAKPERH